MQATILIIGILVVVNLFPLQAQTYPEVGHRKTHKNSNVKVVRDVNPPSLSTWIGLGMPGEAPDMRALRISERVHALLYKARVVHSVTEFHYIRNCHDYAWKPYM